MPSFHYRGPAVVLAVLGLVAGGVAVAGPASAATPVDIPDSNLLNCVDSTLGLPAGTPIDSDQAQSLISITCNNLGITDMTGLGAFTNLLNLTIRDNAIVDLQPIGGLTSLTALDVANNQIVSLAPLNAPNLQTFLVDGNKLTDIGPVRQMTNLLNLNVASNQLTDIEAVRELTTLVSLSVHMNDISDISPAAGLTHLTTLTAMNNHISDISSLSGLTSATTFNVAGQTISQPDGTVGARAANPVIGVDGAPVALSASSGSATYDSASNTWAPTAAGPLTMSWASTRTPGTGSGAFSGTFTLDVAPLPDAPVLAGTNGRTVSGTAQPGVTVIVTDGSGAEVGTAVADGSGNFTVTPSSPLADGTKLTATAVDGAGHTSAPSNTVTVDAVAPDAPVLAATDGKTVTGTAEPGSTVTLTDGSGAEVGTAVADGSGHFTFTPSSPLADGTTLTATATDKVGNTSGPSNTVTVDAVAPDAPVLAPSNGTKVTGTAEPGSTVTVTDGTGALVGKAVADDSGAFTITPERPLADGTTLTATAADKVGNTSGPSNTVTVDAVAPDAPVLAPTDGKTVTGTAEPGSTVTVTDGSGAEVGTAVADDAGNFTLTPSSPLADGTKVTATATDGSGNVSGPSNTVTVDAVAPDAPILALSNGTTVSGTAEPGATVTVTDGAGNVVGTTVAADNGTFTITPSSPLADGTTVTATATDGSGNVSGPSNTVTVDAVAPDAPVLAPTDGKTVTGTAVPGTTVTVTDGAGSIVGTTLAGDDGTFTLTPSTPLADGTTVTATATDGSGNVSGPSNTVTVDAVAPDAPMLAPTDGKTVTGTAEPGSTVTVTDDAGNVVGKVVTDDSGAFILTPDSPLADGTKLTATATDEAGNASGPSNTVTVDAVAPDAPVLAPSNGTTVSGTAEPGSTVTVTDDAGNVVGKVVADDSGAFTLTPESPLADGTKLTATATDEAGNASGPSNTVTVDAVAPDAPVLAPSNGTTVSGTAEPGSTVTVTDDAGNVVGKVVADDSGAFTLTPESPLADGTKLTATATDEAGNASGPSNTVTVDAVAPDAPVLAPSDGTTVSGTAEPGSTVTVTDDAGNVIGSAVADEDGNFSIVLTSPLPDGTKLTATATDEDGNASAPSNTVTVAHPAATPEEETPSTETPSTGATDPGANDKTAGASVDGSGDLAHTGLDALQTVPWILSLLGLGFIAVLIGRRRRKDDATES
ncbi:Ig-like domain-containing protein [Leifsonia sp. WHRI 6310E]|uniref:Ig-like domain-containing protein n=1 Tax=Leifsonia sp. WHRI 6310E TaxID=3162562 RepID=UPI0035A8BD8F